MEEDEKNIILSNSNEEKSTEKSSDITKINESKSQLSKPLIKEKKEYKVYCYR